MLPAAIGAAPYLVLLFFAIQPGARRGPLRTWLLAICTASALYSALLLLARGDSPILGLPAALTLGLGLARIALTGVLTHAYLGQHRASLPWLIGGVAFVAGAVAANLLDAEALLPGMIALPAGMTELLGLDIEIGLVGWLITLGLVMVITVRSFLRETLPLYANRILFWAVVAPALLLADLLVLWPTDGLREVGIGLHVLGMAGAVYAATASRVLDLREASRWVFSRLVLTLVSGLAIFSGLLVSLYAQPAASSPGQRTLVAAGIALLVAILLPGLTESFRWLMRGLISRDVEDVAGVVREYNSRISGEIEMGDLAAAAVEAIRDLMTVRRGALLLATPLEDSMVLEVVGFDHGRPAPSGKIGLQSPIYALFMADAHPVPQYDIDYGREFRDVPLTERQFLADLDMDIFAPIVGEDRLLGVLAVGPKLNDDPFTLRETELLAALADQTVAALQNARLVSDLRQLTDRVLTLNETLKSSNERLEKMDRVKTDFIAIASHELRTPLTQVQGYSDLLLEMARRNMLDSKQIEEVTRSLSLASQRMGEVIGSMLDVSQIDVENMDLSFVEANIGNILKLAIDPYAEAIQERNLTLTARGLRDLPPMMADYKRLVQAFQNLVTNAIKFTPDNGEITITGQVYERNDLGQPVSVRITVADTGIGIDPENHELIFEKFFRVGSTMLHSTGTTKYKGAGPGLGLPIARGIIEGHGGRLWVESAGHNETTFPGSAFHIVLPLFPPAIDAQKRIERLASAKDRTAITAPPRPVDDDPATRQL